MRVGNETAGSTPIIAASGRAGPLPGVVEPQYLESDETRGDADIGGKPSLTIEGAAVQLDRAGLSWGVGANITFAFRSTAPDQMPDDTAGFSRFNSTQIAQTLLALQSWSDLANVTFTRAGGSGYSDNAAVLFGNYSSGSEGAAAFANLPGPIAAANEAGDAWFNSSLSYNSAPAYLNYGRMTLTHEIGHVLGLLHPGDYDASEDGVITYDGDAEYHEDSLEYSVMSYFDAADTGANHGAAYPAAPMLDDIAAIQLMYGANMSTRTGDTVYGFNSNSGRDFYTLSSASSTAVFAVWDAGGTDTLDFSGYSQNQVIDLQQGHFSNVGGDRANVAIAQGAVIEKALGGTGSDTMYGGFSATTIGRADIVKSQGGGNHSIATAISLDGAFDMASSASIISSTSLPHATVRGVGGGGVDYYAFSAEAGDTLTFDIDGTPGLSGPRAYDAFIRILSANGTELAENDDGARDAGSSVRQDSLLTYTFASSGVFYIAITDFDQTGIPAGAAYVLNVSHEGAAVTTSATFGATLDGGAGDDMLYGSAAADILIGGTGIDHMSGGDGNDIYYVDDALDSVSEHSATDSGYDIIYASSSVYTDDGVERIFLTGGENSNAVAINAAITGNAGDNYLFGSVMVGNDGDDTYEIDDLEQRVVEYEDGGIDLVRTDEDYTLGAYVENLTIGSIGFTNGTGNSLDNIIIGNIQSNILDGAAGNDTLKGGAGADRLIGGLGDDVYTVDDLGDVVVEAVGQGGDTVVSSVTFNGAVATTAGVENIALTGGRAANILGNALDNVLTGNAANNGLNGGAGADRLVGGLGNDVYMIDNVGDVMVERAGEGKDLVQTTVSFSLTANVENLTLLGSAAIYGIGNDLANVIVGNGAANVIAGKGEADNLTGGGGADIFDYNTIGESGYSSYDRITDLTNVDRIDLAGIDADAGLAGNQAFVLVDAFSHQAGQLKLDYLAASGFTILSADVNGDGVADMRIVLNGNHDDFTNFAL